MNLTWPTLFSLVFLLWIYSATEKVRMLLHEASLGTIACLLLRGTIARPATSKSWTFEAQSYRNQAPR